MAPTIQELGIDRLSLEDRVSVAEAIWDNVTSEVEAAAVPPAHLAELERRLADSIARPDAVTPSRRGKSSGPRAGEGANVIIGCDKN
jgi:putative addiction module component (TIGR02574 family)